MTVRKTAIRLSLLAAAAAMPIVASAETTTLDTRVYFVKPIVLAKGADLDFGYLNQNGAVSDVWNVPTNGGAATTGTGTAGFNISDGARQPGSITMDTDTALDIQVTVSDVTGTNYTIGTWVCEYAGATADVACTTGTPMTISSGSLNTGVQNLYIGGTLTVTGALTAGDDLITDSATVTVNYL